MRTTEGIPNPLFYRAKGDGENILGSDPGSNSGRATVLGGAAASSQLFDKSRHSVWSRFVSQYVRAQTVLSATLLGKYDIPPIIKLCLRVDAS